MAGDHFYTTSTTERDNAVAKDGYNNEGVACYVYDAQQAGTAAFYRLFSPGSGDHFYTTSTTERDNAVAKDGYNSEGVACYVYDSPPGGPNGSAAFYRLFSPGSGDHFYTTSTTERDNAVANDGYRYEGIASYGYETEQAGTAAFYRLFSPGSGDHFYTTSTTERDNAVAKDGYNSEGVACYVYDSPPGGPNGSVAFYRLFSPGSGDHFYTTSAAERDKAVANYGYHSEGVACYVYGTQPTDPTALYRFFNDSDGDHFYTTSPTEGINAVAHDGYHVENIACYVYDTQPTGATALYRLFQSPPEPVRAWMLRPLVSNQVLALTLGTAMTIQVPGTTVQLVPAATTGLVMLPAPDQVMAAAADLVNSTPAGGTVDQNRAQAVFDALKATGHGDVNLVCVSTAPANPTPAQNTTISISNPKDPRKYAAVFAAVVAAASKLLANWAKNAPAEAAKLAELMGEDSAWLIEALEQTALAAGSAAATFGLFVLMWPNTAQAPTMPPAPLSTVTSTYISWTDPDTGYTTVMTADGVVLSVSPPEIGQVEPDGSGGFIYFPPDGGSPTGIPAPEAGDLSGGDGGDGGDGGGPGRPEIQ